MRRIYNFPGFTRQHLDKEPIVEYLAAEFGRGYVDSTYYKKRGNIHKIGELLQVNNPRLLVLEQSSSAGQSVADAGDLEDIAEPETRVDAEPTGPDGDSSRLTADNPGGDGSSARSSSHTRVGCHLHAIPRQLLYEKRQLNCRRKKDQPEPAFEPDIADISASVQPVAELDRDWLVQPEEVEGEEAVGPQEGQEGQDPDNVDELALAASQPSSMDARIPELLNPTKWRSQDTIYHSLTCTATWTGYGTINLQLNVSDGGRPRRRLARYMVKSSQSQT